MNYFIFITSLIIGLFLGRLILRQFKTPANIVWSIFITFFAINILIVIIDRYILNEYYIMDLIKDSVPGILMGVYAYLIMLVLGIINGPKKSGNPKNI